MEKSEIQVISKAEVATIPSKEELQKGMRKALKDMEEKLAKLSAPANYTYKIASAYYLSEGIGTQGSYTIASTTDVHILIKMLAQVRRMKTEHDEIVRDLNLPKNINCMVAGYNADMWIDDLENRIKTLANTQAVKDINAAKAKLEAFLSEDDRLIKTLSEVENLLK